MKITRYFASAEDAVNVKGIIEELFNIELEILISDEVAEENSNHKATIKVENIGSDCA